MLLLLTIAPESRAQLPIWYLANPLLGTNVPGSVQFNNGDFTAPSLNSHPYAPKLTTPHIFSVTPPPYYLRPDGTPWLWVENTTVRYLPTRTSTNSATVGTLCGEVYDGANWPISSVHPFLQLGPVGPIVPAPTVPGRFFVFSTATHYDNWQSVGVGIHKKTYDWVSVNQVDLTAAGSSSINCQVLESTVISGHVKGQFGPNTAQFSVSATGPDDGNVTRVGILSVKYDPADMYYTGPEAHSNVAVYTIYANGDFNPVPENLIRADEGELDEQYFATNQPDPANGFGSTNLDGPTSPLAISASGRQLAWISAYDPYTVIYVDFDAPLDANSNYDRVRKYTFTQNDLSGPLTSVTFNPANRYVVFVSGGDPAASVARRYDGVSSLNFKSSFDGGDTQVLAGHSSANAANELFFGFDRNLYALSPPDASGSNTLTAIPYAAGGVVSANSVSTTIGVAGLIRRPPAVQHRWKYNYLNVISGPTTAEVLNATASASAVFTGADIPPTIPGGVAEAQSITYAWKEANGATLGGAPGSDASRVYDGVFTVGSHLIQVIPTLIYGDANLAYGSEMWKLPASSAPQRNLVVSVNTACTNCRPAPGGTDPVAQPAALPTVATESFVVQPPTAVSAPPTERWTVRVLDSQGLLVAHLPAYVPSAPISVSGWRPGVYQVLLTRPAAGGVPEHLKVVVSPR